MKWYFCLNDAPMLFQMSQVAIRTAQQQQTSLKPICLYDGTNQTYLDWYKDNHVQVIQHRTSFSDEISKLYGCLPQSSYLNKVTGAFMRIDIPVIEQEDEYVLYTDLDIMFVGNCDTLASYKPKYLAACPDYNPNVWDVWFNSGVILMNVPSLRNSYDKFVRFIKHHASKIWTCYDQHAYMDFYMRFGKVDKLPLEYNWKSFWSPEEARWHEPKKMIDSRSPRTQPLNIIHFLGNKPYDTTVYEEGLSPWRTKWCPYWCAKWRVVYDQVKFLDEFVPLPVTPTHNQFYPGYVFSKMSDDDWQNKDLLENLIAKFGIDSLDHPHTIPKCLLSMPLVMRISPLPKQLAPFLQWLYEHKEEISTYLELGVAYGGLFYTIDQLLHLNPNFKMSVGIDKYPRILGFNEYKHKYPATQLMKQGSDTLDVVDFFDLIYVDLRFYGSWVEKEQYQCRYIAFYDICNSLYWQKIKKNHKYWEFCDQYSGFDGLFGIGVIKL